MEKNQVSRLFVWVHPDFVPVAPEVNAGWEEVIRFLGKTSSGALLQIRWYPQAVEYGYARNPALRCLESLAREQLGLRYQVFTAEEYFLSGAESRQVDLVKSLFNLEERSFHGRADKKLFEYIGCYGLVPSLCVEDQTSKKDLGELAYVVENQGFFPAVVSCRKNQFKGQSLGRIFWDDYVNRREAERLVV